MLRTKGVGHIKFGVWVEMYCVETIWTSEEYGIAVLCDSGGLVLFPKISTL